MGDLSITALGDGEVGGWVGGGGCLVPDPGR